MMSTLRYMLNNWRAGRAGRERSAQLDARIKRAMIVVDNFEHTHIRKHFDWQDAWQLQCMLKGLPTEEAHQLQRMLIEAHGPAPCVCDRDKGRDCVRHDFEKSHRVCSTKGCLNRDTFVRHNNSQREDGSYPWATYYGEPVYECHECYEDRTGEE